MINMVMITGRVIAPIEEINSNDNTKVCKVKISVTNPDKTKTEIESILKGNMTQNALEYIREGDFIGIRGRLEVNSIDGKQEMKLMANAVSFLASRHRENRTVAYER